MALRRVRTNDARVLATHVAAVRDNHDHNLTRLRYPSNACQIGIESYHTGLSVGVAALLEFKSEHFWPLLPPHGLGHHREKVLPSFLTILGLHPSAVDDRTILRNNLLFVVLARSGRDYRNAEQSDQTKAPHISPKVSP